MTIVVEQCKKLLIFTGISFATLVGIQKNGLGSCLSTVSGPIALKVSSCAIVDPKSFDTKKPLFKFIDDLDSAGRVQFLKTYQGSLISGTVLFSQANRRGDLPEKGVLKGQKIEVFAPEILGSCAKNFNAGLTGIVIDEICCNGTGNSPCLLETSYVAKGFSTKILEKTNSSSKMDQKKTASPDAEMTKALELFQQKKHAKAAVMFQKKYKSKSLDVHGLMIMGENYYAMDQCSDAIRPLHELYLLEEADKVWVDDQKDARRGVFLLARCYSKMNKPQKAVFYLNAYLLEPQKFEAELRESLRHKDFGWIHTSADFIEYKKQAELKLKKIKR